MMVEKLDEPCPNCGGMLARTYETWTMMEGDRKRPLVTSCCGSGCKCPNCGNSHTNSCGYRVDHEAEELEEMRRRA